jgi:hypothetical protein
MQLLEIKVASQQQGVQRLHSIKDTFQAGKILVAY